MVVIWYNVNEQGMLDGSEQNVAEIKQEKIWSTSSKDGR
jgi:hypothetical protein